MCWSCPDLGGSRRQSRSPPYRVRSRLQPSPIKGEGIRWSAFKATGFRVFVDPIFLIVIYYTSFQGDP